jgi:hypothetical protein
MKAKLLILTAGLFLAGTSCALAYDLTSDPDATMNQEQKLGPNVRSQRVWNEIYTQKYRGYNLYPRYPHVIAIASACFAGGRGAIIDPPR